ncbi:PTS sugar transporter subunit IIA [Gulosibacter faecalis]|uniref:Ascorbate-specific PTS system EIIA component n=1 Tax=Gulosibacter faecalis TaxID=272240 RepID=A0ABW5UXA4_9MICO|nr:PTS sugar transporter subunit IIA [Gulosibacter faecalis]
MSAAKTLFTDPKLVLAGAKATDWRDAVRQSTALLVREGYVTRQYPGKVISVIDRYGPYTVIAPGLALVHAQPSADSLKAGTAAVTFPDGVAFGHAHFDPVGLVIAVATTNAAAHIEVIADIAAQLERDGGIVDRAVRAKTDAELYAALGVIEP